MFSFGLGFKVKKIWSRAVADPRETHKGDVTLSKGSEAGGSFATTE